MTDVKVFLVTGCFGAGGSGMVWALWERYPEAKILATDLRYPQHIEQRGAELMESEEYQALTSARSKTGASRFAIRPNFKAGINLAEMPLPPSNVEFVACDITDRNQIQEKLIQRGSKAGDFDAIFHFAALVPYNHNRMYSEEELFQCNVHATTELLRQAKAAGVKRLLYCSSTGVVFDGVHPLQEADESVEIPTTWNDTYSKSKAFAEISVRDETTDEFQTLSIRPNGIWCPGETHHTPKLLRVARLGGTTVAFGRGSMDFTHRDNLAQAFICGLEALRNSERRRQVNGKAYFVTDGWPAATVEFFSPLLRGLHFPHPYYVQYLNEKSQPVTDRELNDVHRWNKLRLATAPPTFSMPDFFVFPFIYVGEKLYRFFQPVVKAEPLMTVADFHKATVDNYCSSARAKNELLYEHIVHPTEGMLYLIQYYRKIGFDGRVRSPKLGWWIGVIGGILLTGLLAFNVFDMLSLGVSVFSSQALDSHNFELPSSGGRKIYLALQDVMKIIFYGAIVAHVAEAGVVGTLAYRNGKFAMAWAVQTFLLGLPSTDLFFQSTGIKRPQFLETWCLAAFIVPAVVFLGIKLWISL